MCTVRCWRWLVGNRIAIFWQRAHGVRPVHRVISIINWICTSRLSIKNSRSLSWQRAWIRAAEQLSARTGPPRDRNARQGWKSIPAQMCQLIPKSIPIQIRQLILYYYLYKEYVDGFVRDLTFAERLYKHLLWDTLSTPLDRAVCRKWPASGPPFATRLTNFVDWIFFETRNLCMREARDNIFDSTCLVDSSRSLFSFTFFFITLKLRAKWYKSLHVSFISRLATDLTGLLWTKRGWIDQLRVWLVGLERGWTTALCYLGGGHTRQEDVEVSLTQSRVLPSIQCIPR